MIFFTYFETNFLKNYEHICQWNAVYRLRNNIPLTTNSVEAFNNNFTKFVDRNHSNLAYFISNLQLSQNEVEQTIVYTILNPKIDTKIKKEKEKTKKLISIIDSYDQYYGLNFLKAITLIYAWKFE